MARAKSITIKLTGKQREQLKKLTGSDHAEVKFEAVGGSLASRSYRRAATPVARISAPSLKAMVGTKALRGLDPNLDPEPLP